MRNAIFGTLLVMGTAVPVAVDAQGEALAALAGNATEINFYGTQVGTMKGDLRPEHRGGARGLGFEFSFDVPGGISRKVHGKQPPVTYPEADCDARHEEMREGTKCADTSVASVKRTRTLNGSQYEEELKIEKYEWKEKIVSFELAAGFSQAGAFISKHADSDLRVSVRELPSVTLYANIEPTLPVVGNLVSGYFGMRSGIASLVSGRSYSANATRKFSGDAFQLGPVVGLVTSWGGLNFFVEGSYTWRDFKSIDWDGDTPIGTLPRSLDLSARAIAVGVQFRFKKPEEK